MNTVNSQLTSPGSLGDKKWKKQDSKQSKKTLCRSEENPTSLTFFFCFFLFSTSFSDGDRGIDLAPKKKQKKKQKKLSDCCVNMS